MNEFLNADCMKRLPDFADNYFELAIVDPPYGIKRDTGFDGAVGFSGSGRLITRTQYHGDWDNEIPPQEYFDLLFAKSKNVILFGGNYFTHLIPQGNHWVFWDKLNTMPTFGDGELIYTNIDRNSVKKHTLEYNGLIGREKHRIHPTQKPVQLYRWLLQNYAKPGDLILDSHVGGGSSLVACIMEGFDYIGYEIDKEYYDGAVERIKAEMQKIDLFKERDVSNYKYKQFEDPELPF